MSSEMSLLSMLEVYPIRWVVSIANRNRQTFGANFFAALDIRLDI